MNYREVFEKGKKKLDKAFSEALCRALFDCIECITETEGHCPLEEIAWLRKHIKAHVDIPGLYDMLGDTYRIAAKDSLDDYLIFLEWKRDPDKKFYLPRRRVLRELVRDLEDLFYGRIDFLGVSMPPRTGKSTLCIMFMTWVIGQRPLIASVMSGHSDKLTDGFYREILSIIMDTDTYNWQEVFKGVSIVDKSAKNETAQEGREGTEIH